MKALINKNNEIVDIKLDMLVFDVHPDFTWVDCPDYVTVDYNYDDGKFTPKVFLIDFNTERSFAYKPVGEQLDMLWHELNNTGTISVDGEWFSHVKEVKESLPKE